MSQEYNYEYEWDSRYCYPNSNILINKLGITDAAELRVAEREITALQLASTQIEPIPGAFDLAHLQSIHRYLFSDIYEWAGEIRWVNISKGNFFCRYEYIEDQANSLFEKLRKEDYLRYTSAEKLPERLAYYLSEINVLHPFREGNGRTQRLFIEYLAYEAGYDVDFSYVGDQEMIQASAEAFACDYSAMGKIFRRIITPLDDK